MFDRIDIIDILESANWRQDNLFSGQKILLADDDPISRKIVSNFLTKKGVDFHEVKDGSSAYQYLASHFDEIAVFLADWMMPGMVGTEVIRQIKQYLERKESFIYCILLTSRDSKDDIVRGFENGADDYVTKPFDLQELWARIMTGFRIRHLMMELAEKNRTLRELALKDPLTQLLNRRALEIILNAETARSIRNKRSLGIGMVDIDFFKRVNDTYGHGNGDIVLKNVAKLLKNNIRLMDTVARYGGEEFVLIFPEINEMGAKKVGERIRQVVEQTQIAIQDAPVEKISVTISLGIALAPEVRHLEDGKRILEQADQNVYAAKESGRNRCIVTEVASGG